MGGGQLADQLRLPLGQPAGIDETPVAFIKREGLAGRHGARRITISGERFQLGEVVRHNHARWHALSVRRHSSNIGPMVLYLKRLEI